VSRQPPERPADAFAAYQDHLSRGHQALAQGDARSALVAYRAALEVAGERALPHVMVGRAQLVLGRGADALAAFDDALARSPGDPTALAGKAEALLQLGRRDAADQVRRQLEDPGDRDVEDASTLPRAEASLLAGERAWRDGRTDAALGEWLAAARAHVADGHSEAALDVCQRALLAEPGAVSIHLEMCRLYLSRGMALHAVERMQLLARLVELEPDETLRGELSALAREHASANPGLAELADRLDAPPAS
jgi:tetratricopeptide (TPR) repeat protein